LILLFSITFDAQKEIRMIIASLKYPNIHIDAYMLHLRYHSTTTASTGKEDMRQRRPI